jgi:hemolysin activation/secretion protein
LKEVTAPYANRELTDTDLESLRVALTVFYVKNGYINSGAIIPDQTIQDGVVTIHVIEGKLTAINVEGNRWFRSSYIQNRVRLGAGPPLNIYSLQERLQIIQQDERIQKLNAELKPDVRRGESVLQVQVQDEHPFKVWLDFNNYQSPTVGAERGTVTIANQNLTGYGDILSFSYGQSSGIKPIIDASYTLPFTAYDTTANLRYRKNDFTVVEAPFQNLNIDSKSDIFGITLRQPFYRTLNQEFALAFTGEYERQKTFLNGEPFSFSPGVVNGESSVTALRFSPEWLYRSATQVIAARSRFSLGISALGATNNPSGSPDSQFFAWLFQFQWARRLGQSDIQTVFRLDTQLSTVSLLPLEQIAVGGRYSVRGYRENQLITDQAVIASVEVRIPVFRNRPWADIVELVPFVDFGHAWNKDLPPPSTPDTIASVGLGLRHEVTIRYPFQWKPQFEIFWGVPLRKVNTPGGNLQDSGIHFRLVVAVF